MRDTRVPIPPSLLAVLGAVLAATSGCDGLHESSRTGVVQDVQIRDQLSPMIRTLLSATKSAGRICRRAPSTWVSSNTRNWTRSPARRDS